MTEPAKIRKADPRDAEDFANLMVMSSPVLFPLLFGDRVTELLKKLFVHPHHLFSYTHCYFALLNGEVVGMIFSYDGKTYKKQGLRTGILLARCMKLQFLKRFRLFMKSQSIYGRVAENEYYISNIAVYPEFRGLGFGKMLLMKAEDEAKASGLERCVLDVVTSNEGAIGLYQKMGYKIDGNAKSLTLPDGRTASVYWMVKIIH